jgi:hypothetical protein
LGVPLRSIRHPAEINPEICGCRSRPEDERLDESGSLNFVCTAPLCVCRWASISQISRAGLHPVQFTNRRMLTLIASPRARNVASAAEPP